MFVQWLLFGVTTVVAYLGISLFGQIAGGGASSPMSAFLGTLKPLPLLIITVANMFFALALYFGFAQTRFAMPIALSVGVLTSFMYSVFVLGASFSLVKAGGILLVVAGIALLSL